MKSDKFSYVTNWDFKFNMRKLSSEFQMQHIEEFTCYVRSSFKFSLLRYKEFHSWSHFHIWNKKIHVYCRKVDACFSNVKYTAFYILWRNVSTQMFQWRKQKIHYSHWKPVTMFQYVKYRYSYPLHTNLHSEFHNCNIKNCIFHAIFICHIPWIPHLKLENLSPGFHKWITENFVFHVLKSTARFSNVKLRTSS